MNTRNARTMGERIKRLESQLMRSRRRQLAGIAVVAALAFSSAQAAKGLGPVPNTLSNGSVVDAAELNANFAHVVAGVTAVEAGLTAVEGRFVATGEPVLSASSGLAEVTSTTHAPVSGLSAMITTSGNPVSVWLVPDGSSEPGWLEVRPSGDFSSGTATPLVEIRIERDGVAICNTRLLGTSSANAIAVGTPPGAVHCIDTAATAGTHVYTLSAAASASTDLLRIYRVRLAAEERGHLTP